MRNYCVVATVAIVLLHASCMPCSSWRLLSKLTGSSTAKSATPKSPTERALDILNDYLVGKTESTDLSANIEVARSYLKEANAEPDVVKLVESIQKFDSQSDCTADRIDNLWKFKTDLESAVPEIFEEKTRLGEALVNCIVHMRDVCFNAFERLWLNKGRKIEIDLGGSEAFAIFDEMHQLDPYPKPAAANKYVRMLQVAVDHYFDSELSPRVEEPTKEELASPMGKEYKELIDRSALASKAEDAKKNGKLVAASVEDFVDELYYKPCKELINRPESKSILEPVGQLADVVNLNELDLDLIEGDSVSSFVWASRYYECKVLLMKNKTEFVSLVKSQLHMAGVPTL